MTDESKLAFYGGLPSIRSKPGDIFDWPIITREAEEAVLEVLQRGAMSGLDVTKKFEAEFARWYGMKHALGASSGTAAIQTAMFACGVGYGDEIIGPGLTYWASILQCFSLGATVVFADINPTTLCIEPGDIEHRITDRTRAIVVVHLFGHPADMDAVMDIAGRHNLKVIEDVSHAQGTLYKRKKVGTFGDVGAMSLMSGKSFATGEGGIFVTNDVEIYERGIAWGHYQRYDGSIQTESLKAFAGLPMGGYKYRMHQLSAVVGRDQLKHYDGRIEEISKAMNYFWDLLEGVPGIRAHRSPRDTGSTMGGWYSPHGIYVPEELEGLSVTRFTEALRAEGVEECFPGCMYKPLHLHPLFISCDVYGQGKPTRIANSESDVRQLKGSLPVSEKMETMLYRVPWFKHYRPRIIEEYAAAFRKVAVNYRNLLKDDPGNPPEIGDWYRSRI